VAQGQKQCQELQDKLAASEATVRAQAEQLEKYPVLPSGEKYNSLIQAQARELSHLRQMLREGRGVSRSLAQHLRDALQSFEDLLRGTDIDYYLGQGFREQLAQGRQLADRLSDKLGHLHRLSRELQEKEKVIESLEVKLQERSESPGSTPFCRHGALQGLAELPGATNTHTLWDVPPPGQLLYGALPLGYPSSQKLTGMVCVGEYWGMPPAWGNWEETRHQNSCGTGLSVSLAVAGADLLEEHLVEIRNLRQRLEESICTNDRLREQLERRLASTGKASGTGLGGPQAQSHIIYSGSDVSCSRLLPISSSAGCWH
uniref:Myomegalin n=1 Tax=Malurus cyaneus samueli TaxID=2593467 RepID=A0A8C5TW97_9PASS